MAQAFRFIPLAIVIIVTIVILWTTIGYRKSSIVVGNSDVKSTIDYISTNARTNPINKVYIERDCPFGTQSIIIGKFAGLSNNPDGNMDPADLTIWGKRYRVCIRRNSVVKWLNANESFCPGDYKACASNLCVATSEDCPYLALQVNIGNLPSANERRVLEQSSARRRKHHIRETPNLEIRNRFPGIPSDHEVEPNSKPYFDAEGLYKMLSYRRGNGYSGGNAVVDLNLTINGPPCVIPDRYPARVTGNYSNERIDRGGCGAFGVDGSTSNYPEDKFSSNLDEQTEIGTYKYNHLRVSDSFSNFLGSKHRAQLSIRRKIRANSISDCALVSSSQVDAIEKSINKYYSNITTIYTVLYVFLGVIFILQLLILLFRPIQLARLLVYVLCAVLVITGIFMMIPAIIFWANGDQTTPEQRTLQNCKPEAPFDAPFNKINEDLKAIRSDLSTQTDILFWLGIITTIAASTFAFLLLRSVRRARRLYNQSLYKQNI
eukprot:TRINITY_DN10382_c0_g1_i1.p1 TRINITY_DN10382_c0_g1~~TRINITY_DN10382_c0_g1_i1.p1  ORF type:complete len:490 (-),score=57.13 TRINITY_DN10382_c0_g1_i1:111-1580(-)